jgi:hypothetical protein
MGVIYGVQAFLPHIKAHGEGGHIVNTASMSGFLAAPGLGPHTVTKFGVVGLSETLAVELAGTSVGISVLCPAFVRTSYAENIQRLRALHFGTPVDEKPEPARRDRIFLNAEVGWLRLAKGTGCHMGPGNLRRSPAVLHLPTPPLNLTPCRCVSAAGAEVGWLRLAVIPKPFAPAQLVTAVSNLLNARTPPTT